MDCVPVAVYAVAHARADALRFLAAPEALMLPSTSPIVARSVRATRSAALLQILV